MEVSGRLHAPAVYLRVAAEGGGPQVWQVATIKLNPFWWQPVSV